MGTVFQSKKIHGYSNCSKFSEPDFQTVVGGRPIDIYRRYMAKVRRSVLILPINESVNQ